tara:strand:- start:9763 stop:11226 length:1464 start_codon:yes stop_codon:yes gene_type:complete
MNKFSSSKFLLLICWIISIILFFNCPENIDKIYMSYSLVNTLVATISFLFYQKKIFKKIIFISITFLFTMSMIIVHFQIGVAHVFGFQIENDSFNNFIWGDIKKGNLSIAISSLGLLSFYLGHFLASSFKTNNSYINTKFSSYKKLISLLTFFSIVFYFLFFVTSGSYMSGNYGAGDQLSISNYFSNSFLLFSKSALIIKMYFINANFENFKSLKKYISFIGTPLTAIVFWHILFSIYVGDRGPVINYGFLYFGLYLIRIPKNMSVIFLLLILLVPSFFSILGASRSRDGQASFTERFSESDYESRFSTNFSGDMPGLSTLELALSVRCVNHAISNVPNNYDYNYGVYQLKQIAASVPFLVGFLESNVLEGPKELQSSSDFISYLIQGRNVKYGDATTPVADLYLDFGAFGVLIGFFLFGIFVKKADSVIVFGHQSSLFFWFIIMFYWSGAIYLGRATFLFYIQSVVQIYIIVVLLNSLLNIRKYVK